MGWLKFIFFLRKKYVTDCSNRRSFVLQVSIETHGAGCFVLLDCHGLILLIAAWDDLVDDEFVPFYIFFSGLDRIVIQPADLAEYGDDIFCVQIIKVCASFAWEVVLCKVIFQIEHRIHTSNCFKVFSRKECGVVKAFESKRVKHLFTYVCGWNLAKELVFRHILSVSANT